MHRQVDLGDYRDITGIFIPAVLVSVNMWLLSLLTDYVCYKYKPLPLVLKGPYQSGWNTN